MTLIVSLLTSEESYLICDRMHSIDGSKDAPANASIQIGDGRTLTVTAPKIRINTGTKLYRLTEHTVYGAAGNLDHIRAYVESINQLEDPQRVLEHTHNYYRETGDNAPQQLLISSSKNGVFQTDCFGLYSVDGFTAYNHHCFKLKKENLGVIAIGSGSQLFLNIFNQIRGKALEEYRTSVSNNSYISWRDGFIDKIKGIYADVSKYDDSVSSDVNFEKI